MERRRQGGQGQVSIPMISSILLTVQIHGVVVRARTTPPCLPTHHTLNSLRTHTHTCTNLREHPILTPCATSPAPPHPWPGHLPHGCDLHCPACGVTPQGSPASCCRRSSKWQRQRGASSSSGSSEWEWQWQGGASSSSKRQRHGGGACGTKGHRVTGAGAVCKAAGVNRPSRGLADLD